MMYPGAYYYCLSVRLTESGYSWLNDIVRFLPRDALVHSAVLR